MNIVSHVVDAIKGKHSLSSKRSDRWPAVRKAHLVLQPYCAVCGGSDKLEVHHIRPFHLHPELELEPANLVTLCESKKSGVNCHLWFGHLGNFHSFNVEVVTNAVEWFKKFTTRPKG